MEAIKKITSIKNNTLLIPGLNAINNKEVELIILPLDEDTKTSSSGPAYSLRGKLVKYENPFEPTEYPHVQQIK